jgi:tetratricopeptide (TPR) repeat protein
MDRVERLKQFLKENPEDSFVQHALALEFVKMGDDIEARRLFENLLGQNEDYLGSYYHLAKLLERLNKEEEAISVYEKGMVKAREAGDNHAYSELRSAYEDLTF